MRIIALVRPSKNLGETCCPQQDSAQRQLQNSQSFVVVFCPKFQHCSQKGAGNQDRQLRKSVVWVPPLVAPTPWRPPCHDGCNERALNTETASSLLLFAFASVVLCTFGICVPLRAFASQGSCEVDRSIAAGSWGSHISYSTPFYAVCLSLRAHGTRGHCHLERAIRI